MKKFIKSLLIVVSCISLTTLSACGGGSGGHSKSYTGNWYSKIVARGEYCTGIGYSSGGWTYESHFFVHQSGNHITLTDKDTNDIYEGELNNNSGFTVTHTVDTGKSIGVFKIEVTNVKDGIGHIVDSYEGYLQSTTCQYSNEGTIYKED